MYFTSDGALCSETPKSRVYPPTVTAKWKNVGFREKVLDGLVLFSKMVEKYRTAYVEAQVAERFLLAKPTREKYIIHLEQRILPQWGDRRLCEIHAAEVQQWLFQTCST